MKKFLSIVLLFSCLFLLTGCDTYNHNEDRKSEITSLDLQDAEHKGYQQGYDTGYSDGYEEGRSEEFSEARHEGIQDAATKAERYASINSEWSPEEALAIIVAYYDNEPLIDGRVPTQKEYQEAVATLWHFCEYFYGEHF